MSDADYRQAVTAFYVSLAAMQTSQDLHARKELDLLEFVHAPYYALFIVGPAANEIEIAMHRRRVVTAGAPVSVS